MEEAVTGLVFGIVVAIVIFLATREFWCWYFKINRLVESLQQQNRLMQSQIDWLKTNTTILTEWAKQEGAVAEIDDNGTGS